MSRSTRSSSDSNLQQVHWCTPPDKLSKKKRSSLKDVASIDPAPRVPPGVPPFVLTAASAPMAAPQTPRLSNFRVNIPQFDKNAQNLHKEWARYCLNLKYVFKTPNYKTATDEEKVSLTINWLGADAQEEIETWSAEQLQKLSGFSEFCEEFGKKYKQHSTFVIARTEFAKFLRPKQMPVSKFLQELRYKVKECGFESPEEHVRQAFYEHINDNEIQKQMIQEIKDDSTADDLLQIARKVEARRIGTAHLTNTFDNINISASTDRSRSAGRGRGRSRNRGRNQSAESTPGRRSRSRSAGCCMRCGKSHPRDEICRAAHMTCYNCGTKGHLAFICKKSARSESAPPSPGRGRGRVYSQKPQSRGKGRASSRGKGRGRSSRFYEVTEDDSQSDGTHRSQPQFL